MYVNPFWAGVGATLLAEFGVLIIAAILQLERRRKR